MDPHFREYLAAVTGMQDLYGFSDDHTDVAEVDSGIELSLEGRTALVEAIPAGVGRS